MDHYGRDGPAVESLSFHGSLLRGSAANFTRQSHYRSPNCAKRDAILLPVVTLTCFYELEPIISLFSRKSFADLSQLGGSRNIHAHLHDPTTAN
jgi:hypothetical protein